MRSPQGSLPVEAFLNLTRYLRNEREHVPLYVMARSFDVLNYLLVMHESQPLLKTYVRTLISDAYADIDWDNAQRENSHLYNLARQTIITMACLNGHKECISKSRSLFEDFMKDPTNHKIPSSLTPTVFCMALRYGGATEYNYLKKMMVEALHEEEKHRIIEAMGCIRDFSLFKSFIFGLMDDTSQKYDELELPTTLNGNPVALYALYDILKREFPRRSESFNFTLILRSIEKRGIYIDMLPIQEELRQMNRTLSRESDKTAERAINRIMKQSNRHQMWLSRNANTIYKWLKQELGVQNVPSQSISSQSITSRLTTGAKVTA
ncbi:unnamed protein product [Rodentolepis nana]|uniref:ERAP1_C domain-containing protein n=1 Tax=Rodentolepis nana TaxID=102285 RepID=A0A0R3TRF8_RODNA|nr:unnamed protein product [Rodentolepis nana]